MFIWMYKLMSLLLRDQLPCIIAVPNVGKVKSLRRGSLLFLPLNFLSETMGKEGNVHFLLVEGGFEQFFLPLVKKREDFLMMVMMVIFSTDENKHLLL